MEGWGRGAKKYNEIDVATVSGEEGEGRVVRPNTGKVSVNGRRRCVCVGGGGGGEGSILLARKCASQVYVSINSSCPYNKNTIQSISILY